MLRFLLRPQLLIRNMTEQPYELHAAPSRRILVHPLQLRAADWQPSLERPESFLLRFYDSTSHAAQV